jgi:hypothetical protein
MCKEEKAIEEFYIVTVKASGEQFHHSRCKGCNAKACLAWRKRNRDGYNKSARLWRIKKKYNIDKDTYARMLSNGCEVCGGFDALAVDHDHGCCPGEETCGKCVRGMLCKRHNWAMGNLNDSSDEARALAEYIDRTRG